MSLPLSFITELGIMAGIEVSRTQGDAAAGCHGFKAPCSFSLEQSRALPSFSFQRQGLHQSSLSKLFIAANSASLACKVARQVELLREGDAFLVLVVLDKLSRNNLFLISAFLSHDDQEQANPKFHFEFRTSTSCCSWCFTISIGNERRSGGMCGTTYWTTLVRHEAVDAGLAPLSLAMPCLVPRHGGGSIACHEHRAKGWLSSSSEPPVLTTIQGQKGEGCEDGLIIHTFSQMNGGPIDLGFHERWQVLECLSRALAHTSG